MDNSTKPDDIHPTAWDLYQNHPDSVKYLAALAKHYDLGEHMSDLEIVSGLIELKERGLISIVHSEADEKTGIILHRPITSDLRPAGKPPGPSRRERRQKRRRNQ